MLELRFRHESGEHAGTEAFPRGGVRFLIQANFLFILQGNPLQIAALIELHAVGYSDSAFIEYLGQRAGAIRAAIVGPQLRIDAH